jgi:hypothetical protein
MSHRELFVDFAVHGTVLGLGLGSRLHQWDAAYGVAFDERVRPADQLAREYGLVEADFRLGDGGTWICSHVGLKAVKLADPGEQAIPAAIEDRYGQFPDRVVFAEIAEDIAVHKASVYELKRHDAAAMSRFWIPAIDGGVMCYVISDYQADDFPSLRIGDLYSASRTEGLVMDLSQLTQYC